MQAGKRDPKEHNTVCTVHHSLPMLIYWQTWQWMSSAASVGKCSCFEAPTCHSSGAGISLASSERNIGTKCRFPILPVPGLWAAFPNGTATPTPLDSLNQPQAKWVELLSHPRLAPHGRAERLHVLGVLCALVSLHEKLGHAAFPFPFLTVFLPFLNKGLK